MSKENPPGFFNDPRFIELLNGGPVSDENAIPDRSSPKKAIQYRSTGIDLDEIRTQLQELHRSNMKVIS
ncbi:hypothetical protein ACRQ5D_10865 [Mucilaginibacter sp. P25]|uniref:hypothetical protein n=1 Tax=Mucilaginibacter sp. P25 TaxID=3423945 RepID=UPI003D7B2C91